MSNIASLVAFDGAATPVSHTLLPVAVSREAGKVINEWREGATGVPLTGQVRATSTLQRLKSGVYRTEMKVEVPVMESISNQNAAGYTAAPKVAYVNTVVITGFFHERSDVTGRRLCRQLATNILNGVVGTVTPTTSGPAPELLDQLVSQT